MSPSQLVAKFIGRGVTLPGTNRTEYRRNYMRKRREAFRKQGLTGEGKRHKRSPNMGQSKDRSAYMKWWNKERRKK